MKRIISIALSGVLCAGTMVNLPIQPVYAQEISDDTQKTIYNSFELNIQTDYDAYQKAINDEHFFDDKKSDSPLYDLLKKQIIKIAKGEGNLTFTFDISFTLTESEIKDVLDQLVKDMEPYFYWSNGKGMYSYTEDSKTLKNSITFTFETPEQQLFVSEEGIYSDGNGNQLIPWSEIEKKNLTLEDLKAICGDSLVIIMDDDNEHILFVGGNFSNDIVTNSEEALKAIECMKELMGIPDHLTLALSKTTTDMLGMTYYSFNALQTGGLNKHKIVIVGVDSDGKVSCVTNPSQDVWSEDDSTVNTQAGLESYIPMIQLMYNVTYLEEYGIQTVFYEPLNQYCYVFVGQKKDSGNYVKFYLPVVDCLDATSTSAVEFYNSKEALEDENEQPYEFYFDTDKTTTMSFTDFYGNVVELPVGYDDNGFYLLDTSRKIVATATYGTDNYANSTDLLKPYYFQDPAEVNPAFVSAFLNMSNAFDLYEELGLFTTDRPIVMNFNADNTNNNASATLYSNSIYINLYNSAIGASYDVVAHELTHAIQMIISNETTYSNANGALMESYADICGNILEMISADEGILAENVKAKVDEEYWGIGETVATLRYMGYPEVIYNASKVYGQYFMFPVSSPIGSNDQGGVHINSGILNRIAYCMNKEAGLSNKQVLTLFYLTESLFNIQSDYKTVCGYVEYYMHQLNYTKNQIEAVKKIFDDACVNEYDDDKTWANVTPKEGTHKVTLTLLNENSSVPANYKSNLNVVFNNTAIPVTKVDDEYGVIVSDNMDLSTLYVNMTQNATYVPVSFTDSNVITSDTHITVNADDIVSTLYSTYSNNGYKDLCNDLASIYSDTMKTMLVKPGDGQSGYILFVTNNNADTDALSSYYGTTYNEKLQGYDILVETNGVYDFQLNDQNGTKINYDNVSVANTQEIDLTQLTPDSQITPEQTTDEPVTTNVEAE